MTVDSNKRIASPAEFPPQYWGLKARPIRPYAYREVTILRDGEPQQGKVRPEVFVLDLIHPEVLALDPQSPDTFVDFVKRLGLNEFLQWALEAEGPLMNVWEPVLYRDFAEEDEGPEGDGGSLEEEGTRWRAVVPLHFFRSPEGDLSLAVHPDQVRLDTLVAAWTDPVTVEAFSREQDLLRKGLTAANPREAIDHANERRPTGRHSEPFPVTINVDDTTGIVYEEPDHIIARAWLEVLDAAGGKTNKVCAYCQAPFIPSRSDQVYCPGRPCADRAFRSEYDKRPYRREYQRMHKRWKRGTIADAEWEKWKAENSPKEVER